MNLLRNGLHIVILISAFAVAGCANNVYSFSYTPINQKYAHQLELVSLGMKRDELKALLPEVVVRGQNKVDGQIIEALELEHNYWAGVGGRLVNDRLWFYFQNGALIKWGQPNDWPQKPDLIIENREK